MLACASGSLDHLLADVDPLDLHCLLINLSNCAHQSCIVLPKKQCQCEGLQWLGLLWESLGQLI